MNKISMRSVMCVLILAACAMGADWPNYRGAAFNGASEETQWTSDWPASGPKVLWQAEIGTGFSTMAVADGCVYAMGNQKIDGKEQDVVWCLNAKTGKEVWKRAYEEPLNPNLYEGGPNATPTVKNGKVYTLSRTGKLYCLNAKTGAVVWQEDVVKTYGVKVPDWGFASSPLVMNGIVYINAGTLGMAIKDADKSLVWLTGKDKAAYASMVPCTINGTTYVLVFGGEKVAWVDAKTGDVAFEEEWKTRYAINAADPIVLEDGKVFISSGYSYGCGLFEVEDGQLKQLYKNKVMKNQCYGSVLNGNYVYGFDGQVNGGGKLTCVDVANGKVVWSEKSKELGTGTVLLAGDRLIVLGEKGKLFVVKATPDGYQELASAQVLTEKCWTVPALANGLLYARDANGKLVCLDLRK